MGYMKELDIRIYGGGEDAIAAACELAGLAKERRGYDAMKNATGDITDIVTVLRGVGFAAVPPSAGDSASLLHYCVTCAADEIERLREERRWTPVGDRLPKNGEWVLWFNANLPEPIYLARRDSDSLDWGGDLGMTMRGFTQWMPLPSPPEVTP
jgi:hypothetical protein